MRFNVRTRENILGLGRILGYKLLSEHGGEYNFVRPISDNRYPRFHMYVEAQKGEIFFNLHLDQKQPSYKNQTAHSGEYDGELVEREAERIRAKLG